MPGTVGFLQGAGVVANGVDKTNPSATDVIVDTGAVNKGNYLFHVTGYGSAAFLYDFQIRNAANGANIYSFRRNVAAGNEDFIPGFKIPLETNHRWISPHLCCCGQFNSIRCCPSTNDF